MIYLGVDISKQKFDVCLLPEGSSGKKKSKVFKNAPGADRELKTWLLRQKCDPAQVTVVMEATSVYHENLAFALHHDSTVTVCMANPQRVREFARGMGILTKNDTVDAFVLACYGELKQPEPWVPPAPEVRKLRALLRRRDALQEDVQRTLNRLEKALSTQTPREVITSLKRTRQWLQKELERIEQLIADHINNHPGLKEDLDLLKSIKCVKDKTGQMMLAVLRAGEFRSASQVAAYLGLVPVERSSGSSVWHRPRMSKAGPPEVRAKLYVAALSAIRYNAQGKALYERLLARGTAKKAAVGAVMRKLVHLCYGVLKTRQPWDANYAATA
ncbi:IS110 family transposase [Pantoea sp. B65]|uniref:IS110 family transposase n=1 Tax=Pantoea sp. B65 TaxID=2813359 RepID=UPI0039B5C3C3